MEKGKINNVEFLREVMKFFAEHDIHEELCWEVDDFKVDLFVVANDILYWGCTDIVDITPETFPVLKECVEDLLKIKPWAIVYLTSLFTCRVNKCRPQGAAYPKHEILWDLFDACGPEREVGLGNPKKHPRERNDD